MSNTGKAGAVSFENRQIGTPIYTKILIRFFSRRKSRKYHCVEMGIAEKFTEMQKHFIPKVMIKTKS